MSKSGYVYILTNPCLKEVPFVDAKGARHMVRPVKIGIARDVEKRLGTLNTSLYENFEHHLSMYCPDAKAVENVLHHYLKSFRITTRDGGQTEFFACPLNVAIGEMRQVQKDMHLKEYHIRKEKMIGRSSSKIKSNLRAKDKPRMGCPVVDATTKSHERRVSFSFSAVSIPVGSKLTFTEAPYSVLVADDKNKITYQGKAYSLSGFVRAFHPRRNNSGAYQGPKFFTYKGVRLTELKGRSVPSARDGHNAKTSRCVNWKGPTELAKYIATQGGNVGAFGGILHFLSRRKPCSRNSKWRIPLEAIGVKFDKMGFVVDWQCAKRK